MFSKSKQMFCRKLLLLAQTAHQDYQGSNEKDQPNTDSLERIARERKGEGQVFHSRFVIASGQGRFPDIPVDKNLVIQNRGEAALLQFADTPMRL